MKEFRNILDHFNNINFKERKAALATVVRVRGSSYRSPGARMLMTDDGRWVGSISGGCLEGDALRKAREVIMSGEPRTVTYDTMDEENSSFALGLGCNGIIDVLIQPIDPEAGRTVIHNLEKFLEENRTVIVATVFANNGINNVSIGDQMIYYPGETVNTGFGDNELSVLVSKKFESTAKDLQASSETYTTTNGTAEIFIEVVQPSIDLIIFGGGFDVKPVVFFASQLGWRITVMDECIAHLIPRNFPEADKVVQCQREYIEKELHITPYSAVVIMSHSYNYDIAALRQTLRSEVNYIGLLGPKKRSEKMLLELADEGIELTANDKHRLHYPVGLDIGAETAEEIALSIISEINTKFTNRSGGYLKYRNGPIHQRESGDQVFRQIFINHQTQESDVR